MRWSYKIVRVAGIDVYLHGTFLLLLAFYGWLYYQQGGLAFALTGVSFILLLFLCVLLHEFGHAFAARAFGIRTPDITLLPIGGVARLERIPKNPWHEFLIAIAGPAVNVVIASGLYLFLGQAQSHQAWGAPGNPDHGLLHNLMVVNVMLILFNLIPAFPMDGGRVLRALLATQMPHAKATLIAARVGQGIAVLFILAALWFQNPILFLIAIFVFMGAQQELAYANLRQAASGLQVGQAMVTRFETISDDMRMGDVTAFLLGTSQAEFPVVDDRLGYHGMVTRDDLLRAAAESPADSAVSGAARNVQTLAPDAQWESAFEKMNMSGEPVLPVVNSSGQIVGLVSIDQLTEFSRRKTG